MSRAATGAVQSSSGSSKRLLLSNCRIWNPAGAEPVIEPGFILISGDNIDQVGPLPLPDAARYDEVIDLGGAVVLPGMINAHTHLYSALALGMPPPEQTPRNFVEILQQVWWKLDRALDEASIAASFDIGLVDALKSGVTTVFDHHSSQRYIAGSLDLLADRAKRCGMNISTAFEITDRNGPGGFADGLRENLRAVSEYGSGGPVHPLIGLHASFTLSDDSLAQVRDALAGLDGTGVHIHVSEDRSDEIDAQEKGYRSVIQRLRKFDLLSDQAVLAHGLHIGAEDVEIIRESGAMLIHNPTSNANNRVGLLPGNVITTLRPGLGTDGMQSNMLAEAKEGLLIRSSNLPPDAGNADFLKMLFGSNADLASRLFQRPLGKLEAGYRADLAFYDYVPKTPVDGENPGSHILFGLGLPVHVMTAGKFRIRHGRFTDIDEAQIRSDARVAAAQLWQAMNKI